MNVTLMKAREAHLFPLFNPVAFNSQQTFIPVSFLHVYLSQSVLSKEAKLLHQRPLPPPPSKPNFPLPPTSSFNSCQAVLPLALLICEFSSGALSPLSLNFSSLSLGFSTPTIFKATQDPLPNALPKHCILQCLYS